MNVEFLLVTCCLEESRAQILKQVVESLEKEAPELNKIVTVFDNASTTPGTIDLLKNHYDNVYHSDKNVGYWSAIDWWLDHVADRNPTYTHIIESDTLYYGFDRLKSCVQYLETHPDVGSVRLHRYSVANKHLYNKDVPHKNSDRKIWQSHLNKVAKIPVTLQNPENDVWETTFLTQLPALNRYKTMVEVFKELRTIPRFSELDFQRLYWKRFQKTGILDGGLLHGDLGADFEGQTITGSWTSPSKLQQIGYHPTRFASITPKDQYTVTVVR